MALPRFQTETFASFVAQGLGRWLQTVQDWAQHSTSLHLVFYEVRSNNSVSDVHIYQQLCTSRMCQHKQIAISNIQDLKRDPVGELEKLLYYLHLPADQVL